MKVAIVCDWLVTYAGAERVLEEMLRVFPEADVFSVVDFLPEGERAFLGGRRPRTTFLQSLPGARRMRLRRGCSRGRISCISPMSIRRCATRGISRMRICGRVA